MYNFFIRLAYISYLDITTVEIEKKIIYRTQCYRN